MTGVPSAEDWVDSIEQLQIVNEELHEMLASCATEMDKMCTLFEASGPRDALEAVL